MNRRSLLWLMLWIGLATGGCQSLRHPAFVEPSDDLSQEVPSNPEPGSDTSIETIDLIDEGQLDPNFGEDSNN